MRSVVFVILLLSATSYAAPIVWQWDNSTPDLFPAVDIANGTIRLAIAHDKLRLSNGTWVTVIDTERDADFEGAAMVVDGERIYVATYNRLMTGCTLAAFAVGNGAKLWSVPLVGAGPIGHSKYSNRVQLRAIDGRPVVFGAESAARYVEVREPITGALASTVKLAQQWFEPPIAESLFQELSSELATNAAYAVSVNEFLSRTGRMKDVDHAGRGQAFSQAVTSLQHVELQHGRFELEIELVERHGDFVVKAKRGAATK